MTDRPTFEMEIEGFALTPRMKSMGITGMNWTRDGWVASFKHYPGASFVIPEPIVDWLRSESEL